jgi:hypothetical protein
MPYAVRVNYKRQRSGFKTYFGTKTRANKYIEKIVEGHGKGKYLAYKNPRVFKVSYPVLRLFKVKKY